MLLVAGCGGSEGGSADGPRVVVTIAPIADLVKRVGGDRIEVTTLVPVGADAHTYFATPEDAKALARADVFFDNGLGLNDQITQFAEENLPTRAGRVLLAEQAVEPSELVQAASACHAGHCHGALSNPHVWIDPLNAASFAARIGDELAAADPDGAGGHQARASTLRAEIEALHRSTEAAVGSIPPGERTLVAYHDSWAYFSKRYGFEHIGALQPASFAEPSGPDVVKMVSQLRTAGAPAFFGSEVFPTKVLEAVGREAGVRYVPDLRDDRLPGDPGSAEHSYVGMMRLNARTIVEALGGDPTPLDVVP